MSAIAAALSELQQHPDFRVLRRFRPRADYGLVRDPKLALFVDVESTGLNREEDRIIQFAAVRFEFDSAGNIGQVGPVMSQYQDPGMPIAPEITALTGIDDAKVAGQSIDRAKLAQMLDGVVLVIAHNAEFDRQMCEKELPGFDGVAWACSQRDVKWERFGCHGVKLDYLVMQLCGEFYDAHDALADCLAGVHLLASPKIAVEQLDIERAGELTPFQMLLDSVREPTLRLCAWGSPIETKDRLRLRRFRWDAVSRVWFRDVKASELEAERAWLLENVYDGDTDGAGRVSAEKISRKDLYSRRAG